MSLIVKIKEFTLKLNKFYNLIKNLKVLGTCSKIPHGHVSIGLLVHTGLRTTHGVPELEARRVLRLQRLELLPHDDVLLSLRGTSNRSFHHCTKQMWGRCSRKKIENLEIADYSD